MKRFRRSLVLGMFCATAAWCAAQVHVNGPVQAGSDTTLQVAGGGTVYVFGPGGANKHKAQNGAVAIPGDELKVAGRYVAIVDGKSTPFAVKAAPLQKISFITHPSRVPAAANGAIVGSAFLFDRYQNLVLDPTPVTFKLAMGEGGGEERKVTGKDGVAWVQLNSGKKGGAAQFTASAGDVSVRRVVQQVAADPCQIRMKASRAADGNILVETDPIKDCSGNAVPDGTIVTFTSVDAAGRSTVDARIKRGFARAELPASKSATLSVAAGVVLGNEIHWGGGL